jgi:hypothetical protein
VTVVIEKGFWGSGVLEWGIGNIAGLIEGRRFLLDIPTGQGLGDFFYSLLWTRGFVYSCLLDKTFILNFLAEGFFFHLKD